MKKLLSLILASLMLLALASCGKTGSGKSFAIDGQSGADGTHFDVTVAKTDVVYDEEYDYYYFTLTLDLKNKGKNVSSFPIHVDAYQDGEALNEDGLCDENDEYIADWGADIWLDPGKSDTATYSWGLMDDSTVTIRFSDVYDDAVLKELTFDVKGKVNY